ncbi:hypothetical protein N0V93_009304 [Gnomoniopsis smithogilvyi]|uniref:Uncharacterized protein n=1 Tax=Gnomoniopsis smithogilvyi TaxID=1191159 RepID=A0A9W8YKI0_9PEZI|nr:hypothetical protein N0V93_009304 [Gnomoniopsis smithogilvyi]
MQGSATTAKFHIGSQTVPSIRTRWMPELPTVPPSIHSDRFPHSPQAYCRHEDCIYYPPLWCRGIKFLPLGLVSLAGHAYSLHPRVCQLEVIMTIPSKSPTRTPTITGLLSILHGVPGNRARLSASRYKER